uniref:Serine palmitoyltransferase small subunit B n=1 Tax=Pygocentrus nattereri TaxID=42514 RepID=A0AAR2JU27_PYGNA
MDVKNMREYMGWLYYQYLLITGIYVLEPWEKSIFNTVLFTMVAMVVYTSYVFVPIHIWCNFETRLKKKDKYYLICHLPKCTYRLLELSLIF